MNPPLSPIRMLDPAAWRARLARRAYWVLLHNGGRVIGEWERDWSEAPYGGRRELRLYCPNGRVAVLGGTGDNTGRFFQFKIGLAAVGPGASARGTLAQVIGRLDRPDGQCTCWAWEYGSPGRLVGPFQDRFPNLAYGGPVTTGMSPDVLGVER